MHSWAKSSRVPALMDYEQYAAVWRERWPQAVMTSVPAIQRLVTPWHYWTPDIWVYYDLDGGVLRIY